MMVSMRILYPWALAVLLLGSLGARDCRAQSAVTNPPPPMPAGFSLQWQPDFGSDAILGQLEFTDPKAWRRNTNAGRVALELVGDSRYTARVRSPSSIALLTTRRFGDFVLEAELLQTGRDYGHRDLCLFFGFQEPGRYYYVHFASKTDPEANQVFIVDGKPFTRISTRTTAGSPWGQGQWHRVRVQRLGTRITVWFDDLTTPAMEADDATFGAGYLGFGSFNDSGMFARVRVWAPDAGEVPRDSIRWEAVHEPAPVDNPLKGFVPYAGQGRDFPHSLEFDYLPLAALMTGPDQFDWAPMERLLDGMAGRGCQGVVRIYLEYPRRPSGVPGYLLQSGLKMRAWTNTNTQPLPPALDHTPDYEDPRLRAALTNFIAALGARYDGDPRLGFVTAGLLGTWGEWHCHPHAEWFASRQVQAEVMDAYEAAFQRTPVLLRYPAGDDVPAHASNGRRRFGYHDDSFAWATLETGRKEDDWFFLAAMRRAGPAAMERWRIAPIGGEIRPELWPCLWKDGGCGQGQDLARSIRETHATWLMESSTSRRLTPEERQRALAAARSLGYELQVTAATAAWMGRQLKVSVTFTNRGVAPFYAAWPVRLTAVGQAGREAGGILPLSLNEVQPGTALTREVTLELTAFPPGEVRLLLGVPNPLPGGRPLRFANADPHRDPAGRLTLGTLVIPRPVFQGAGSPQPGSATDRPSR